MLRLKNKEDKMKDRYIIELIGCDATTTFIVKVSDDIYKILKEISTFSQNISKYPCEPAMKVHTIEEWNEIWKDYRAMFPNEEDESNPDNLPLIRLI